MKTRLIAKLDVKPPFVVKPIFFEGLRKVGTPDELSEMYYQGGIDEVYYIDIVSSLYQREILTHFIRQTSENIQIPFCAGGGIKSVEDAKKIFDCGADKISINTFALQYNPKIIDELVHIFGSQAIAINVEAKNIDGNYFCYSDCGRINSKKQVLDWAREVQDRGAGEIFLQNIDRDGLQRGFDLELSATVVDSLHIPVVIASGAGSIEDILELDRLVKPSGIAISSILHYSKISPKEIKEKMREK